MNRLVALSLLAGLSCSACAVGQDRTPAANKLKQNAEEAMKKSDVLDARVLDTENLVVATALPEARAKVLSASLQKTFDLATRALKFEQSDLKVLRPTVFVFAELDNFRQFQRSVLKVRPDDDEFAFSDMKRDDPLVAVSPRRGERTPNFETLAASELCRALLTRKGGNARLPQWMKDGFARAVEMRQNPRSIGTDRAAVVRMAPRLAKTTKGTPVADKAWNGSARERDLVAASLMDFLTFGPGAEKLGDLFSGLTPSDAVDSPTFASALMSANWMLEDLDRAWRDWIGRGSPAGK